MKSKKMRLKDSSLYLVLDTGVCDYPKLWEVFQAGVNNGVDIVQLRDKLGNVPQALEFIRRARCYLKKAVPFIVNDRADLAYAGGACGVHVGQDDLPVAAARKMLPRSFLVGKSCQTLAHLQEAEREGADYAGFGSVFKTKTKPERLPMDLGFLREVAGAARLPVFAIGGITLDNIDLVLAQGIKRVAVCRAILLARDPAQIVREFKKALMVER